MPESALPCEDWQLAEDDSKPASLLIQLQRCAHVFPWMRFVYAEGDNNVVKLVFATHLITVNGQGLAALVAAVAGQRVVRIIEPSEHEAQFGVRGPGAKRQNGPSVSAINIHKFE